MKEIFLLMCGAVIGVALICLPLFNLILDANVRCAEVRAAVNTAVELGAKDVLTKAKIVQEEKK